MYYEQITKGILTGISVSGYCFITCGIGLFGLLNKGDIKKVTYNIVLFLLIRFLLYGLFAIIIGVLGSQYKNFLLPYQKYIYIFLGIYLLYVSKKNGGKHCINSNNIVLFSILSAIHPCPPFLTIVTTALVSGGIINSVIIFIAFYIGSSILLTPLFLIKFTYKISRIKTISKYILMLLGLLFLYQGLYGILNKNDNLPNTDILIKKLFQQNYIIKKYDKIYELADKTSNEISYVLNTHTLVPETIIGYNGPVPVLFRIRNNKIIEINLLPNYETKRYLNILKNNKFLYQYLNKNVNDTFVLGKDVDAYTGATITAKAINNGIKKSIQIFSNKITDKQHIQYSEYLAIIISICLVLIHQKTKKKWLLRLIQLYSIIVISFIFTDYLSIYSIYALLTGGIQFSYISPFLILFIFVFIMIFIKGRIYCVYICPFGTGNDIIRDFIRHVFKIKLFYTNNKILKKIKYVLLLVFIITIIAGKEIILFVPFTYIFSTNIKISVLFWSSIILFLYSIIDKRFYCKYLCILNGLFKLLSKPKL